MRRLYAGGLDLSVTVWGEVLGSSDQGCRQRRRIFSITTAVLGSEDSGPKE